MNNSNASPFWHKSPIRNRLSFSFLFMLCFSAAMAQSEPRCNLKTLPYIRFASKSIKLSESAKKDLGVVAQRLKQSPECGIVVTAYSKGDKRSNELCRVRVYAIRLHLIEKQGISEERISISCVTDGGLPDKVEIIPQ